MLATDACPRAPFTSSLVGSAGAGEIPPEPTLATKISAPPSRSLSLQLDTHEGQHAQAAAPDRFPHPLPHCAIEKFASRPSSAGILTPPQRSLQTPQSAKGSRASQSAGRGCVPSMQECDPPDRFKISSRDLEKSSFEHQTARSHHSRPSQTHYTMSLKMDREEDDDDDQKRHAMWILIYLSSFAPLLALTASLYAIFASLSILLLSPLSLCIRRQRLHEQCESLLTPPLSIQLDLVFSPHELGEARGGRVIMLIIVNLLGPILAFGIMLAAWIAAGFWFFAVILGDPNEKTGKNGMDAKDDGRLTVLYVCRWWERWLVKGLPQ